MKRRHVIAALILWELAQLAIGAALAPTVFHKLADNVPAIRKALQHD